MSGSIRNRLLGAVCGILFGAVVTSYAYKVQGGVGPFFAFAGGLLGGVTGFTAATRQLRLHYLGAAIGSVVSLTLFQVQVCDGTHFGMPATGATLGAILGALPESILVGRSAAIRAATSADPTTVEQVIGHKNIDP